MVTVGMWFPQQCQTFPQPPSPFSPISTRNSLSLSFALSVSRLLLSYYATLLLAKDRVRVFLTARRVAVWYECMHLHVCIAWKCSVQIYRAVIVCTRLFRYNCAMMDGAVLDWSHACPHKGALWRLYVWRWREIVYVCVCVRWGLEKEGMGLICNRVITGWPAALDQHLHLVQFPAHFKSIYAKAQWFLDILCISTCSMDQIPWYSNIQNMVCTLIR